MEEQVVFYFSLVAGLLLFISVIALHQDAGEAALQGEAKMLIKSLEDTAQQVRNSPFEVYAEVDYGPPERLSGREYELRIQPSRVLVVMGSESIEGSLEVANSLVAQGGDVLVFYKEKNSDKVFVRVE
jgi:hypothetical protein